VKYKFPLSLLLLSVLLVSVVLHFPAPVALNMLTLPPSLKLSGVTGTIWQGHAEQVRWKAGNSDINYGEFNWSIAPAQILLGQLSAMVQFGTGSDIEWHGKGEVGVTFSHLYARNLQLSMPAATLQAYIPTPVPVALHGQIEATITRIDYAAPYCQQAQGEVVWNQGVVDVMGQALSIGMAIAKLQCNDNQISISGTQSSSQVDSQFTLDVQGNNNHYQTKAWFAPKSAFPPAFQAQLKWLPAPDGQGRYHVDYSGRG
jgi:general secretion pathway protein N